MRTVEDMVRQEVTLCLSYMVSTLAKGGCGQVGEPDLLDLCEEAMELCVPVPDYDEAALDAGAEHHRNEVVNVGHYFTAAGERDDAPETYSTREEAARAWCEANDIEATGREIFEHWAVTDWLAEKLEAKGERVGDLGDLKVWGRTTTGQAISADAIIEEIHADAAAAFKAFCEGEG